MNIFTIILTILGLAVFEVVNSVDNAVINAEVLKTMQPKSRRWFLIWGVFIAVFVVRGLLPWIIIWSTAPSLGFMGSLVATFSNDPVVAHSLEAAAPSLLIVGGTFLILLFLHWLFIEPKSYALRWERYFKHQSTWFYTVAAVVLLGIAAIAKQGYSGLIFGAMIGSTIFFITHGFKETAEQEEKRLSDENKGETSDKSKILYLEVIDAVFSIDGVLGAFAFTLSIPIILLGNGLGAIIVRQLTIGNIERIAKYRYLKNGAMYSVFVLGLVMLTDAFGFDIPTWFSPVVTLLIIGFFTWKSLAHKPE